MPTEALAQAGSRLTPKGGGIPSPSPTPNPTMLKVAAGIALLLMLWQPMEPARRVTADVLHTAADLIAR